MNEERTLSVTSVSTGDSSPEGGAKERTPEMIGAEIRMYVDAGRRITLLCGIEIGRRLVEAKEMLNHGEWLPWLKRETEFSERSAQNYMKVFNTYGAAQLGLFGPETNTQTFADLPISKALTLLSLPESEREAFAEEVGAETLSVRDLEALVKERTAEIEAEKERMEKAHAAELYDAETALDEATEARDAAEIARKEAENAREVAEIARREAENAREVAEIARRNAENDREAAENAQRDAEEQLRKIKAELDEIEKRPQATVYVPDKEAIAKAANDAADAEREKHREEEKKLKAKIAELKEQAKKNDEILRSAQDDMQKAQADAKDAREAAAKAQQAEAEAQRLRGDIEALRKQLSMAAPEVAEFKAAFERVQREFSAMLETLDRIQDGETKGKLRKACAAVLDGFMGRVKE